MTRNFIPVAILLAATISFAACTESKQKNIGTATRDSLINPSQNPYKITDQSPMDMSYFPVDFPLKKMAGEAVGLPLMRVIYSRPHRKGRTIFGEGADVLVPYGKEWRLGANEGTEIEFFKPVVIGTKNVAVGRYILFCYPHVDSWEIVLNRNLYSWGLHVDSTQNVLTQQIPVMQQTPEVEDFTMIFAPEPDGADLIMAWDKVKAILPIKFM